MSAVVLRLRAEVRQRWLPWLGVALVAGIAERRDPRPPGRRGAHQGCLPGLQPHHARRATPSSPGGAPSVSAGAVDLDDVERLPQVRDTARAGVSLVFTGRSGDGRRVGPGRPVPGAAGRRPVRHRDRADGRPGGPGGRTRARVDEATASFVLAERLGLHPGSTDPAALRPRRRASPTAAATLLSNFGARLAGAPGSSSSAIDELADGPDVTFRIVGHRGVAVGVPAGRPRPRAAAPPHPCVRRALRIGSVVSSPLLFVRLRDPGQLDAFSKGIERLADGRARRLRAEPCRCRRRRSSGPSASRRPRCGSSRCSPCSPSCSSSGQALVRQAFAEAGDDRVLRALGLRARRAAAPRTSARGLVIGVTAALLAVVVAMLMSPLMPVGLARVADLHHGFDVDPRAPRAGRARGRGRGRRAPPARGVAGARRGVDDRGPAAIARSRADCSSGGRLLAERRHRRALRARSRAGVRRRPGSGRRCSAPRSPIALLAGLWSFQVSLQHMLDSPRLYGWNWSVKSGAPALPDISAALRARVRARSGRVGASRRGRSRRPSSGSSGST